MVTTAQTPVKNALVYIVNSNEVGQHLKGLRAIVALVGQRNPDFAADDKTVRLAMALVDDLWPELPED